MKLLTQIICHRWSVVTPFILYMALLLLAWVSPLSLRSTHNYRIVLTSLSSDENKSIHSNVEQAQDIQAQQFGGRIYSNMDIPVEPHHAHELLEDIFGRADNNKDGFLSLLELTNWINVKIQDHIEEAMRENVGLFTLIDVSPRDGTISWDEYHSHFLQERGLSRAYAEKHDERHKDLGRSIKETIMRDRASWSEAARTDPDHLTLDEFLAFRHPESSHATILSLVEELFDKFDRDGDEFLTEDEFASPPQGHQQHADDMFSDPSVEKQRRKEFQLEIDKNGDKKADRKELLMYIDPRNPRHARQEANSLMSLSDTNTDGKLSLSEVLANTNLFLGSKMVDTARSFHDEF